MASRVCFLAAASFSVALAGSPWPQTATTEAQRLLALMTPAQKFLMVHGSGGGYVGNVPSITLSDGTVIPPINLEDGPQGVADGVTKVTCWPSALTVVQTWDEEAMYEYGAAMGNEQWLKGTNVVSLRCGLRCPLQAPSASGASITASRPSHPSS